MYSLITNFPVVLPKRQISVGKYYRPSKYREHLEIICSNRKIDFDLSLGANYILSIPLCCCLVIEIRKVFFTEEINFKE